MLNKLITFGLLLVLSVATDGVFGQIAYTRHLSDLRIKDLQNLAVRLEHSISSDKQPCDEYFDFVCSRNRPIFSIMGSLPSENDLINLLIDLQKDDEKFPAKRKMMDFFLSCNSVKSIDDCYREAFYYFRPVFGYIVAAKHWDRHDDTLVALLERFITRAKRTEHFATHSFKYKLESLKEKLRYPQMYLQVSDLNKEYASVNIYVDNYDHNIKALEELRKGKMTYMRGVSKTVLDWTMYSYQSRNKPMSYYYATLNVHLWMMFYNSTGRMELKKYEEVANCLKLPAAVNSIDEARLLAVIYIKSFEHAWEEYSEWITSSTVSREIFDHENEILRRYKLDNKQLFFTLYAQNFCDFGKELAENVFFLGLKLYMDFYDVYSCGAATRKDTDCLLKFIK